MPEPTRRLAAVLFSDIVGYTATMGRDEDRAIETVSRSRDIQRRLIERYRGRFVQTVGDGVLCTFESAVDAATCALAIQQEIDTDPDIRLRIGIHEGDIVFRTNERGELEVIGDGVNVASRIQTLADPGTILASERLAEELSNHPQIGVRLVGARKLRNVERPVNVYAIVDRERGAGIGRRRGRLGNQRAIATALALVTGIVAFLAFGIFVGAFGPRPSQDSAPQGGSGTTVAPDESAPEASTQARDTGSESARAPEPSTHLEAPVQPPAAEQGRAEPAPRASPRLAQASPSATSRGHADDVTPIRSADGSLVADRASAPPEVVASGSPPPQVAEAVSAAPAPVSATPPQGPREVVAEAIDEILRILREGPATRARLRRIEHVAYAHFDFEMFSRLVLAVDRGRFSRAEFEEFMREFEVLLAQRYSQKIRHYDQEKIEILGTREHPRGDVTVSTVIVGRDGQIPVDYRLDLRTGVWGVIDVVIDGVSLMLNYREQFNSVLKDGTPEDLLAQMRQRNATGLSGTRLPANDEATPFESVRKQLLDADGGWREADARVWADPNPAEGNEPTRVYFEADCDCKAMVFVVHDSTETITLLYPTSEAEGQGHLTPGVLGSVELVAGSQADSSEGYATDILKLFVVRNSTPRAQSSRRVWDAAAPPESLGDLRSFLQSLDRNAYDSAVAYLQVVE